jgi:hypothetical protein
MDAFYYARKDDAILNSGSDGQEEEEGDSKTK